MSASDFVLISGLMKHMADKTKINLYLNTRLNDEFKKFVHLSYGKVGLLLSAAMLQFLETAAEDQVAYVKRVYDANEGGTMDKMIDEARRKSTKQKSRG